MGRSARSRCKSHRTPHPGACHAPSAPLAERGGGAVSWLPNGSTSPRPAGGAAMPRFAVILPAAGKSSRFRDKEKKVFASIDGRAVWRRTAELFVNRKD